MDNDLKKLIDETVETFLYSDICPSCGKQIVESADYTEDGGKTWRHSECRGIIRESKLPLSGEEKYYKQEPGGDMATSNTTTLATNETSTSPSVTTSEETKGVKARNGVVPGEANFMSKSVVIVNLGDLPLKVTVHEFSAMADEIHSVKKYLIKIDNV
jgi:hypothetical protein